MRNRPVIAFVLTTLAATSQAQSLHDYLVRQKWNAEKSGLLLALETERVFAKPVDANDQTPPDLASFDRKSVRIGHVTAVVPISRLALTDEGLPNPYDVLTDQDKFAAFLGSLNSSELRQLTSPGISPHDVSGLQRLLLESLIPHPLRAQEFVYSGDGYGSTGDPIPVSTEVAQGVRLQVFKALDVGFSPLVNQESNASIVYGVSSMIYRPTGTHVYRAADPDKKPGGGGYMGRIVDNDEKASQLDFKDPRLTKSVEVATGDTIGSLIAKIHDASGLEIYPDARIAKHPIDAIGDSASASDLLRAIALCVGGAYRRVGPAYVLTYDIEGQATRAGRAQATAALAQLELQSKIVGWRQAIKSNHIFDQMDFLPNDMFNAKAFLQGKNLSPSYYADLGWFPESIMNPAMRIAVPNVNATDPITTGRGDNTQTLIPDRSLQNKIHLKVTIGYRFILPNGIVLDNQSLDLDSGSTSTGGIATEPLALPMLSSVLPAGSSAGYRTDDPDAVTEFCNLAKDHGIKEVWIETESAQAIAAATKSGLTVDLVVRPWAILKGDRTEPDLNALGMTGAQLNKVLPARIDYPYNQTWWFKNSYSPADPNLSDHWSRLVSLASNKQIHSVVLVDPIPGGYRHWQTTDYDRIQRQTFMNNGVPMPKNLMTLVPSVYDFGYTVDLRLTGLRKFGIDPIDLEHPLRRAPFALIPYFESDSHDQYILDENKTLDAFVQLELMKNQIAMSALASGVSRLSAAGHPILVQYLPNGDDYSRSPTRFGPAEALNDPYSFERDNLEMISINPVTAEDTNGSIEYKLKWRLDKPTCFDFSEVPSKRLPAYFNYMFKNPGK